MKNPIKAESKFLLDENVDVRLATYLREKGYSASIPPKGLTNGRVISLALKEKRILLTNDTDFTNQTVYSKSIHSGIIVFRIHPPSIEKLISALDNLLVQKLPKDFVDKVYLLEKNDFRLIAE